MLYKRIVTLEDKKKRGESAPFQRKKKRGNIYFKMLPKP
jgi:hypothetical protein